MFHIAYLDQTAKERSNPCLHCPFSVSPSLFKNECGNKTTCEDSDKLMFTMSVYLTENDLSMPIGRIVKK